MNTIPVALFSDQTNAEPLQRRLAEAGFFATINDGPPLTWFWFVSKNAANARVEVPADQFERAEQSLLDWGTGEECLRQAIRCPECHSLRVDYPQYAKNSLSTNLALGLLAQLRFIERHYYCEDCHFTWPKEGMKARRSRPHLAPFYFIEGVEQTASGKPRQHSSPPQEPRKAA